MLYVGTVGADEQDKQRLAAAKVIAVNGLAGHDIGEREVGGDGAEGEHGGFSEGHGFFSWSRRVRRDLLLSQVFASVHRAVGDSRNSPGILLGIIPGWAVLRIFAELVFDVWFGSICRALCGLLHRAVALLASKFCHF